MPNKTAKQTPEQPNDQVDVPKVAAKDITPAPAAAPAPVAMPQPDMPEAPSENSEDVAANEAKMRAEEAQDAALANATPAASQPGDSTRDPILDAQIQAAVGQMTAGDVKGARITLLKASNDFKTAPEPLFYVALTFLRIDDPNSLKQCEANFRKVLERSPGHVPTLNNLGLLAIRGRMFTKAYTFLSSAAKSKEAPEAEHNIGRFVSNAARMEVPKDDMKKIGASAAVPANFRPGTGWLYMPPDKNPRSTKESMVFLERDSLEDMSCCRCMGFNALKCRPCKGSGRILSNEKSSSTVRGGVDRNQVTTLIQDSSRLVPCANCDGLGRFKCPDCENGREEPTKASRSFPTNRRK